MEEDNINWYRLISALNYYNSECYKTINLNWAVDVDVSNITKPIGKKGYFLNEKELVASGEQSFLQLIKDNKLSPGKYSGITPCFRDESEIDFLHQSYFMKVELIDTINPNRKGLDEMISIAKRFYSNYLKIRVIEIQDDMYDIIDAKNGFELGSYGTRDTKYGKIIFGTGLAEPRLSKILKLQ